MGTMAEESVRRFPASPSPIWVLGGVVRLDLRGNTAGSLAPLRGLASLAWVHVGGSRIEDLMPPEGMDALSVSGREDRESPEDGARLGVRRER